MKRLQRFRPSKDEWETEHERWLREAVFRADGVDGLEGIARQTKRPRACLAWYEALADQGDWTAALKACDVAARIVRQSHWRGELLGRGRTRGAGAWTARSEQAAGSRVARRSHDDSVTALVRRRRWRVRAYPIESSEGPGLLSQGRRAADRTATRARRRRERSRRGASEVAPSGLVQSRPSRTQPCSRCWPCCCRTGQSAARSWRKSKRRAEIRSSPSR